MMLPRAMRISLRGMPMQIRAVYFGVAAFAAIVILAAIWSGPLVAVPLVLLFLGAFLYTAPWILGRRWRPLPKPPTRRPVVRRRRA